MIKPSVVLDTNIYLSAIIFGGVPRKILELVFQEKIILYTSPEILLEIAIKLKDKFNWSDEKVKKTIKSIANIAILVRPKVKLDIIKKDPSDNKILEAAVSSKSEFIISGDKHLLDIQQFKNIKIIKARKFLDLLSITKDTSNH